MSSYVTSFLELFQARQQDTPNVSRVEIPLIQRDYAQGRTDVQVQRIRRQFLDAIRSALTGPEPLGLDFIYGELDNGTLRPLDGQQRLTTLFLLHWYLASRTGHVGALKGVRFEYATRPGARLFCQRLSQHPLPEAEAPGQWITDQPWYLHTWRHDPTVQSILVMLDAIDSSLADDDLQAAWARLTDPVTPAVSFHVLPIDEMGSAEDLYIKMNSRGRPLTDFESFKAQLEKKLDGSPRADEFAHRVDGPWSDIMWPLRNGQNLFDEQFLNYLRFIIDLCEWREGHVARSNVDDLQRAERAFASGPAAADNLDFLFSCFDTWTHGASGAVEDTDTVFRQILSTSATLAGIKQGQVAVFSDVAINTNLFKACCRTRSIGNRRALFLHAILLHRLNRSPEFPQRLRITRNLIESSTNEIRAQAMPKLILDVERVVLRGDLDAVESFNTAQKQDELLKQEFLKASPEVADEVYYLEDHDLLRGCLMAFELDAAVFAQRADAFRALFAGAAHLPALTGALLACGDYSRPATAGKRRFGSPSEVVRWSELLAGDAPSRNGLNATREALGQLLDQIPPDRPVGESLTKIQQDWLRARKDDGTFDWRYYLVKYPAMREGKSGIYASDGAFGFSLCMLEGTHLNGYYRDPYLLAVARESDAQDAVCGPIEDWPNGPWFTGYSSEERWMRLRSSGVEMRCVADGWVVKAANPWAPPTALSQVSLKLGLAETASGLAYKLSVPQTWTAGQHVDTADRVRLGADLLTALLDADL